MPDIVERADVSAVRRLKRKLYDFFTIKPDDEEWKIIRECQQSGILRIFLREVRLHRKKRQYERDVIEREHIRAVDVKLMTHPIFPLSISPYPREVVKHKRVYSRRSATLYVYLEPTESLKDLPAIMQLGYLEV